MGYQSQFQSTDDAYVEADIIQITPKVSGHIVDIKVQDNQKIEANKDKYVVKIDDEVYKVRLAQAEAELNRAIANQNNAKANLKAANSEIQLAKLDLDRYQKLFEEGAVSKQILDKAQTNYDAVVARQTHAKENINTDGSVGEAEIEALRAVRDQAKLNLSYTEVVVPISGIVTNRRVEKGSYVSVGSPMFAIVPDKVWVVANFKENQVGNMQKGQSVDIKIDAYKGKTFKGHIDSIQRASGAKSSLFPPENAVGSFVKIVQRVPVKIVFEEGEIDVEKYPNIIAGLSVVPKVKVK
ncbi:MAG: HlyD family secretion protein [Candidatus Gastranaerophilales bacterium]|nr:HlyD family secretion protein [Candidatus Gastranaerophilales bacterium]